MLNVQANVKTKATSLLAALSVAGLFACGGAVAAMNPDFANPAVAMSGEAVIASGTCIAKYASALDDRSKPAAEIGQKVAKRCAKQISRSAGLASWMVGKPEDFEKNLKYTREDLTTNAVERSRASVRKSKIS